MDRSLPQHQTGDPHSFRYVHTVAGTEARWLHVQIQASAGSINLTRQGFVYVPPASETVAHDDDGNLTEDAQWEYTWDAENRMTSATQKALPVAAGVSTPPPARKRLEFAYDYRNRRIAKRVLEQRTENSELIWKLVKDLRFVHDGYQMIAELDHTFATGTGLEGSRVTRTFLWGPDVSGTMSGAGGVGGLLSTTYQGVSYQVCSDANGNVTGLVPTSGPGAGTLVARFDYDPFGNRITNTGPDVELCPFGFSTKYTDAEMGIVNYELRPYQAGTGRFMCGDPIEEDGGVNLYGFVGNDAVNFVDYIGEWRWPWSQNAPLPKPNQLGQSDIVSKQMGRGFCGAAKWEIGWTLNVPSGSGFIAQQMTVTGWYKMCGQAEKVLIKSALGKKTETFAGGPKYTEFWEVRVMNGQLLMENRGVDTWEYPGRGSCSKGKLSIVAEAQFFPSGILPVDAAVGGHPASGSLRSVRRHEWPGSGGNLGNKIKRTMKISWDCCDGNSHLSQVR